LEDNINEKTNSSELAIDGRLLGELVDERSVSGLLRDVMRDFRPGKDAGTQEHPNEEVLAKTWPELRFQLRQAADAWRLKPSDLQSQISNAAPIDLDTVVLEKPLAPALSIVHCPLSPRLPSWRRVRLAA
jgi:hypothetical protein